MTTQYTETSAEIPIPTNPFPGLRPFDFNESHLFFGRDGQSEQLIGKLGRTHFLAVVGTSGSGKSSLVRAGLLPALLGGFMTGAGSGWRIAILRPGNDPIGNLSLALNAPEVFGSQIEANAPIQNAITEANLRRGSRGLVETVRQNAMPENESLLVLVDQFEELFRFAREASRKTKEESEGYQNDAAAFVKLLLEAHSQREARIYIVLTMRSDFLGDCAQFWDLPETVNESQYLTPRLTRDQLREAITGPVAVGGGEITQRLLNRLLNDVGNNQDQLPVLQHLLMRVWDERKESRLEVEVNDGERTLKRPHREVHQSKALDLCCYEAVGGMAEALSRHADEAFNELPDDRHRDVTEKLFKALTEKGPDNREIRRPTMLGEICAVADTTEFEAITVIDIFRQPGRSFLMPPADVELNSESLIDISHESLIRGWARLKKWVEEEARSARIYHRLAETAELHGAGKAGLWRDPDLQVALDWRDRQQPNLAWTRRYHPGFDRAMAFLNESQGLRDTELRQNERKRKRAYLITITLGVIFLALSLFALRQTQVAKGLLIRAGRAQTDADSAKKDVERSQQKLKFAELQIGEEEQQTTAAMSAADAEKLKALAIGQEAKKQKQQAEALKLGGYARVRFSDGTNDGLVQSLLLATESLKSTLTPEGYEMAANGIQLLPPSVPLPQFATLPRTNRTAIEGIAFSNSGRWIATVARDSSVIVREVNTGREFDFPNAVNVGAPYAIAVAFSPDDRWIATGGFRGVSVWNTSSWEMKRLPDDDYIYSVAFSPDSQFLAIGSRSKGERVYQYQTSTWNELPLATRDPPKAVRAVAFSPDNRWLATADGQAVKFWKLPEFRQVHQVNIPAASLAFSPTGELLAIGGGSVELQRVISSVDGEIRLASEEGEATTQIHQTASGGTLAFDSTGRFMAVASEAGIVRVWRLEDRSEVSRIIQRTKTVAFSPDGNFLVTGNEDGTIGHWAIGIEAGVYLRHPGGVNQIEFSPGGKWLATACDDGMTRVFDLNTRAEIAKLEHGEKVSAVAFMSGERFLLTIGGDTVRVFETGKGWREVAQMTHKDQAVIRTTVSPDGKLLSTWAKPTTSSSESKWTESQTIWDWVTGRPIAAAFQDYEIVVSGRRARTTTLVRDTAEGVAAAAAKWQAVRMGRASSAPQKSSDGLWSASFDSDRVLLAEVITGRQIHEIKLDRPLRDLSFSPDARWLAMAGEDGVVQLWPLAKDEMIREACARLPRNLSPKERAKYLGDPHSPDTCPGLSVPVDK